MREKLLSILVLGINMILIVGIIFILLFIMEVRAAPPIENNVTRKIDWININNFSDKSTSETYSIVDTGGQLGSETYTSENYKIMAGFGYYYSLIPFSFTVDSVTTFDFASLQPNTPQTAYTDLTVTSGAAHGYSVVAYQNHQLEHLDVPGYYIEDTLGDNSDITHQQEGMWELSSTHGFGYTLTNLTGTDAVFTNGYRQFADISADEQPQPIMQNSAVTRTSQTRLQYKLNIGSEQDAGYYANTVNYKCRGVF